MKKNFNRTRNMFANISNPWAYLAYKLGSKKKGFQFKAPGGIRLEVPKRLMPTFKEMFFRVPYQEEMPKHAIKGPAPLVIDIGANVGYFSFYVFSKFPKATIHAFEPFPPNGNLLKQYREQHPKLDLHVHQKAVSGEPGTLTLGYDPSDEFSTSASSLITDQEGTISVECITLPEFIRQNGIKQIDWLKVDCEGAEYEIFKHGADEFLPLVKAVTLETHDSDNPGENQEALEKLLAKHGFQVRTNGISPLIWAWREE